ADMQEKDDADERDDCALLHQRPLQGTDSAVNQVGTIIDGLDAHTVWQARCNLKQPVLHVADNRESVFAKTLKRDAGNDLTFAVQFGNAATLVGRKLDAGHILEQDRHATFAFHHDLLEVREVLDVPASADGELGLRKLDRSASYIHVAVAQGFANPGERNAERLQ